MTTADYLTQLQQDRTNLVNNLETKGITGLTGDETFTELVPQVLNIPSGSSIDDYISTTGSTSAQFEAYVKKIPDITTDATSLQAFADNFTNLKEVGIITALSCTSATQMFYQCTKLETVKGFNFSNSLTSTNMMFRNCTKLETAPSFNTSGVSNFSSMFQTCTNLKNVPVYDASGMSVASYFAAMYSGCYKLTDESLDNILQMCISAGVTSTLYNLAIRTSNYPVARIEALPHYQDFIDAGWTIS